MFTGIIEQLGRVEAITKEGTNLRIRVSSAMSKELKIDQSVSHNGICLTVVNYTSEYHEVIAINETIKKTTVSEWKPDMLINLERAMESGGRFDGHFVQGHVDQVATCTDIVTQEGSWVYTYKYDTTLGNITVEKGSICVNGVSLTVVNATDSGFSVAIIPYTYEHTDFSTYTVGDKVNLEFDVIGKYISKMFKLYLPKFNN